MKIAITPVEARWLHTQVNRLIPVLIKDKQPYNHVAKMRYKFQGAGSYVHLSTKERLTLFALAIHFANRLKEMGGHPDLPMIIAIAKKMEAQC